VELGARIGQGNTAEIFEAGDNKVLKLFMEGYPEHSVLKEYENSRLLDGLGLPVAHSYETVVCLNRHGIVYDRITGCSLLDSLMQEPSRLESDAAALAELHRQMLACRLPEAASLKGILRGNISRAHELGASGKAVLLNLLDGLPDGDGFCHGDFHFGNVMMGPAGCTIIDYMNLCRGHEYGDIARTVYLLELTPVPPFADNPEELLLMKKMAAALYLKGMGVSRESLSGWL
jgi:hypothetical protein